ncbi:hypothetical protein [Kitasatospora sp. NPDC059327]|uniref:hypothetical protein n=1 Tax=Kitasatospora sp. NPDC059327 TaxID=3346803 RepID=UPI003696A40F
MPDVAGRPAVGTQQVRVPGPAPPSRRGGVRGGAGAWTGSGLIGRHRAGPDSWALGDWAAQVAGVTWRGHPLARRLGVWRQANPLGDDARALIDQIIRKGRKTSSPRDWALLFGPDYLPGRQGQYATVEELDAAAGADPGPGHEAPDTK